MRLTAEVKAATLEPALRRYVHLLSRYRKNEYPELEAGLEERVARA